MSNIIDLRPYGDEYHYHVHCPEWIGAWAHWQKAGCVRMVLSIIVPDGSGHIVPVHPYGHNDVAVIVDEYGTRPEGYAGGRKNLPLDAMIRCLEVVGARIAPDAVRRHVDFLREVYIDKYLVHREPFSPPHEWYTVRATDWCMLAEEEGIAWNMVPGSGGKIQWCDPKDCITDRKLSLSEFREGVQSAIALCREGAVKIREEEGRYELVL